MIILFGSQKGGVGKSTLCVNIAGYLSSIGKNLIIVDADDQGSVMSWYNNRNENLTHIPVISASGNIKNTLIEQNKHYDYVICDSAGRDSKELRTGLLASDIFISPMKPSQMNLDTISHITEVFTEAKDWNEKIKGFLLLNMCSTNLFIKEANQAAEALLEFPQFLLTKNRIFDRKIYRDTWAESITVIDADNEKAKTEIENLVNEVIL
ncbi:MAG TPA: AAA family ATPase [Arsenophonus nasoniae]|uniref:AAA family ATPase n=1 Tax=Arsenophonus nasoniae TaxID=638 RepID=UPI003879F124